MSSPSRGEHRSDPEPGGERREGLQCRVDRSLLVLGREADGLGGFGEGPEPTTRVSAAAGQEAERKGGREPQSGGCQAPDDPAAERGTFHQVPYADGGRQTADRG